MLIAEELLLLLTTDEGKAAGWGVYTGYGLAAAAITDLIVAERITLNDDKDPRVSVQSAEPTGYRVLDPVLERIVDKTGDRAKGRKLSSFVQDGKLDPTAQVVSSLAEAGIIAVEPKRLLGLVPERRPTVDAGPELRIRDRLCSVLAGQSASVSVQDAALLSILQGLGVAHKVLEAERAGMSKGQLKSRINQIAADLPAGDAVARCVQTMNMVIISAAILPAITTSSAGS